jgi:hypothetical protein
MKNKLPFIIAIVGIVAFFIAVDTAYSYYRQYLMPTEELINSHYPTAEIVGSSRPTDDMEVYVCLTYETGTEGVTLVSLRDDRKHKWFQWWSGINVTYTYEAIQKNDERIKDIIYGNVFGFDDQNYILHAVTENSTVSDYLINGIAPTIVKFNLD